MTQFTRKVRLFSNNRMEVLEAMTYSEQLRVLRVLDLPAEWTLSDGETPVAATVKRDTVPGTDHLWRYLRLALWAICILGLGTS